MVAHEKLQVAMAPPAHKATPHVLQVHDHVPALMHSAISGANMPCFQYQMNQSIRIFPSVLALITTANSQKERSANNGIITMFGHLLKRCIKYLATKESVLQMTASTMASIRLTREDYQRRN